MKIFVSYSSEDRAIAEPVAIGLRQTGHQVFFDRDNLPQGEEYHARIRNEIAQCDLFVFFITPASIRETSYALTELARARERWQNPSGRILPVLARSTPDADIPAYLAAVTYVKGSGNLTAETLAAVSRIAHGHRARRNWIVAAAVGVALCGAAIWWWQDLAPGARTCNLAVLVGKDSDSGQPGQGLVLDAVYGGATTSFLVSGEGATGINVGPLPAGGAWDLELRSATEGNILRLSLQGCPQAATVHRKGDYNIQLAPSSPR